jgi:hypothetical protein
MSDFVFGAKIISCLSFLYHGARCIFSKKIEIEFDRYGLSGFRKLTGVLQILGSLGIAAGFFIGGLTALSSLGLSILMMMGFFVRLKIRDPFLSTLPALFFSVLNFFIFFNSI